MTTRRKLKDAIAQSEELSFVFGQAVVQQITQAAQEAQDQVAPLQSVLCTFTFVPDGNPVRHYYDPDELNQWAHNDIQINGIRSALWVRPHPFQPDKYELVAGLRRYKAAEILRLETVPIKVFNWDDRTAFHAAISENANRRDFSALEELDNTLRLLEIQLGCSMEEAVSLLYRMNNAAKGISNQNVLVSPEAEVVKQVFDSVGRITWQSFVATRLPLLKKPPEILASIRHGDIHYTKGIILASVKDAETRFHLIQEATEKGLSLSEIKQRVKSLTSEVKETSKPALHHRLTQVMQQAKKNKRVWKNPDKSQQLEELLSQIEAIIAG